MELRRVLKPSGVLRLVLPDLGKGIHAYLHGHDDYFRVDNADVKSRGGRFIVHMLWYGSSKSLFTVDFIEELLLKAGFVQVIECEYRRTECRFSEIIELDNRENESLYIEATKQTKGGEPLRQRATRRYDPWVRRVIEVVDVSVAKQNKEHLRGAQLDRPVTGARLDSGTLTIVGWIVGQNSRAVAVEVTSGDEVVGQAPVESKRPGLVKAFSDTPEAGSAGFRLILHADGKGVSDLQVTGVLEDKTRVPIGTIRVRLARRRMLSLRR
jgi:hypothetical protein